MYCGFAFYWLWFVDRVYNDEEKKVNCGEGEFIALPLDKRSGIVKIVYKYFCNPLNFLLSKNSCSNSRIPKYKHI